MVTRIESGLAVLQSNRPVLGEQRLPERSLFDADRLRWLIYRLLTSLAGRPGFEPVARYLAVESSDPRRQFQLPVVERRQCLTGSRV